MAEGTATTVPVFGDGPQKPWLCCQPSCRTKLGYAQGDVVRIRYKDHYVVVKGGSVWVACRGCGTMNNITDEVPEAQANGSTGGS